MINPKLILALILIFIVFCLLFVVGAVSVKAQDVVVDMKDFVEGDLLVDGFDLKAQTKLDINAVGGGSDDEDDMYAYGWIINSLTREPVWILNDQETNAYKRDHQKREYTGTITLPGGKYEAYFFVGSPLTLAGIEINIDNLDDALNAYREIVDGKKKRRVVTGLDEDVSDFRFLVKAAAGTFTKFNPVARLRENAIVDMSEVSDDFSGQKGFTLRKEMKLKIIAIGEYSTTDRVFVDYGWIIDAKTRKKVWQMDKWNTSWAGGGRKNRGFLDEVTLPAGNYVATFTTDDSHSFADWNVLPPFDPLHYGLSIHPVDPADARFVAPFEDSYSEPVVVAMTRVRDNFYGQKWLRLARETDLHILAIGEIGSDDEFADFGWIEDAESGDRVWEMSDDNTEHAGGASKNRRFDGIVTLPAGTYTVYFVSDDSHSYRRWNATEPTDKEKWGITIFGVGDKFDPKSVIVLESEPLSGKILVDLTGMSDDADAEEKFRLETAQTVRIRALGEGIDGRMYDYGWIESSSDGDVVWEMTYRRSKHAGGASKNREVDTRIQLEAGEYIVHYVTDDSHSFPEFNAARPNNPQKWGIIISKE